MEILSHNDSLFRCDRKTEHASFRLVLFSFGLIRIEILFAVSMDSFSFPVISLIRQLYHDSGKAALNLRFNIPAEKEKSASYVPALSYFSSTTLIDQQPKLSGFSLL